MAIAELNISTWKIAPDSAEARPFVDNVQRINALAERMPGFMWRLTDEGRDADGNSVIGGPDTLVTLSVWRTADDLERFVWKTAHRIIYERKAEWFKVLKSHHLVLWWVGDDETPSLADAKERLDHLDKHGDTDFAFGWSHLTANTMWREQRCA